MTAQLTPDDFMKGIDPKLVKDEKVQAVQDVIVADDNETVTMLMSVMTYLFTTKKSPSERLAHVNLVVDAAVTFAMLISDPSKRGNAKEQICKRIMEFDFSPFETFSGDSAREELSKIFHVGALNLSKHKALLNVLGGYSMYNEIAAAKPNINGKPN